MENNMENEMETGGIWDGNLGVIMGLYWDNGKENGNYNLRFRDLGFWV